MYRQEEDCASSHVQFLIHLRKSNLETVGADVLGGFVTSVTDVGHLVLTLEPPPHSVVNTWGVSKDPS